MTLFYNVMVGFTVVEAILMRQFDICAAYGVFLLRDAFFVSKPSVFHFSDLLVGIKCIKAKLSYSTLILAFCV